MSETFSEVCPYYLSLGMEWNLFWEGDCRAVIAYRKKSSIELERENRIAWLHGMYTYEAVGDLAPILHAFAKKGSKPNPYTKRPHPVTKEASEREKAIAAREEKEKILAEAQAWMERVNARKSDDA